MAVEHEPESETPAETAGVGPWTGHAALRHVRWWNGNTEGPGNGSGDASGTAWRGAAQQRSDESRTTV